MTRKQQLSLVVAVLATAAAVVLVLSLWLPAGPAAGGADVPGAADAAGTLAAGEAGEVAPSIHGRKPIAPGADDLAAAPGSGSDAGVEITIRGRLLGRAEVPLDGAVVHAHAGSADDRPGLMSAFERFSSQPAFGDLATADEPNADATRPGRATTGDASGGAGEDAGLLRAEGPPLASAGVAPDGTFELRGLRRRHLRLALEHRFYGLAVVPVHVPPGAREASVGLLEPYLGAHVRGRVIGAGDPAGCEVRLAIEFDSTVVMRDPKLFGASIAKLAERTRADAEGWFEFTAVPPAQQARLWANAQDACAEAGPVPLVAGTTVELLLSAVPAGTLVLSVRDSDGAPVAGASAGAAAVAHQSAAMRAQAARRARTDAEGRSRLPGLTPGMQRVRVARAGFLEHVEDVAVEPGGEKSLQVTLQTGGFVEGVVVAPDGTPIGDARIAAVPAIEVPMLGDMTRSMLDVVAKSAQNSPLQSGADGRFRLSGIAGHETFTVAAAHPKWLGGVATGVRAGMRDVRVALQAGAKLTGRVVDAAGAPLPEFSVETTVPYVMGMRRPSRRAAYVGADAGAFTLAGIPPGRVTVRVSAAGFADHEAQHRLEDGQLLDLGEVRLSRAAAITGIVQDRSGLPVAGAAVREKSGSLTDHPLLATMYGVRSALTDANGRFLLDDVRPGSVVLRASAPGHASATSAELELAPGQRLEGVAIVLAAGGTIAGRLLLPPGRGARGWHVAATHAGQQAQAFATTGGGGAFRLEHLDPGSWTVQAMDPDAFRRVADAAAGGEGGFDAKPGAGNLSSMWSLMTDIAKHMVTATCRVRDGATEELVLDGTSLAAGGIALACRVTVGGEPLASGFVEARPLASTDAGSATGSGSTAAATMRLALVVDGEAQLTGLAPGKVELQVRTGMMRAPVGEPTTIDVAAKPAKQSCELALPGGTIAGRVLDAATDQPLPAALVRVARRGAAASNDPNASFGFAVCGDDGTFQLLGLEPGTYTISVNDALFSPEPEARGARLEDVRLAAGERRDDLVLRARVAAVLRVRVTDAGGDPVPAAAVLAVDDHGQPLGVGLPSFTAADGTARIPALPAGSARAAVAAAGLCPTLTEPVSLDSAAPGARSSNELAVVLRRGPRVHVQIEDGGKPLRGAIVTCRFGNGPWLPPQLLPQNAGGAAGTLDLGHLPAGRIAFRVQHPATGTFEVVRDVPPGPSAVLILSHPR